MFRALVIVRIPRRDASEPETCPWPLFIDVPFFPVTPLPSCHSALSRVHFSVPGGAALCPKQVLCK